MGIVSDDLLLVFLAFPVLSLIIAVVFCYLPDIMRHSIEKMKNRQKFAKEHVAPKLLKRLRIFVIIITIIVGIAMYDVFLGQVSILLAILGLSAGTAIGLVAGRMFKIFLHTETQKVVSRLDKIGVIFLVLYIAVEIGRKWLFGYWLHGAELNAFGLTFLAGLLLGRLLSMRKSIKRVLIEENKM